MQYANKGQNDKAASIRRRRELVMRDEEESIQTKLEVSQPGDAQEQEADHIANKVVNGGDANVKQLSAASSTVQSKSEGDVTHAPDSLQRSLDSTKGQGQSMDDTTKSEMESKMGADFSGVKIHTGNDAHTMSESVNAKAFTHGQDIYFKNGNYDPGSSSGKNLLAHELTHTVQNGNGGDGVQRKVWRYEDANTINKSFSSKTLDDYSGLKIKVTSGLLSVYESPTSTSPVRSLEPGTIFSTGKLTNERYGLIEESAGSTGTTGITGTSGAGVTGTGKVEKTGYLDFNEAGPDLQILEVLPERLLYQIQSQNSADLSFVIIKIKAASVALYEDAETKTMAPNRVNKDQLVAFGAKNEYGNYPVSLTGLDGKSTIRFFKGNLNKNKYTITGVSQSRFNYDANKSKGEIADWSNYTLTVRRSNIIQSFYPTNIVQHGQQYLPQGSTIRVLNKVGSDYYLINSNIGVTYLQAAIKPDDFEITATATVNSNTTDTATGLGEFDPAAIREKELATVDYTKINSIVNIAVANYEQAVDGINEQFDQLTNAEISVLRGLHRWYLLIGLMNTYGGRDRVIRLLKNTGPEVLGEMQGFLMQNEAINTKLMEEYSSGGEQKKEMASAIGMAAGQNEFSLKKLNEILNSDDFSEVDEVAYALSDQDMASLSVETRLKTIRAMITEANYYWHISSDEDDETMMRLISTTPRDKETLAELEKGIHSRYKDDPTVKDNLYDDLIKTMNTDQVRVFYGLLGELFAAPDMEKVEELKKNLGYVNTLGTILELTLNMNQAEFDLLTTYQKYDILHRSVDQFEVGGDEEIALIKLLSAVRKSEYPDMQEYLVYGNFYLLKQLVNRIDEDSNPTNLRNALNPILEGEETLITHIDGLLESATPDDAEFYMHLLSDTQLATLSSGQRQKMLLESGDWWADGTDETVIIRLTKTTPAADQETMYKWFKSIKSDGVTYVEWLRDAVDGGNRDPFLQAVGALHVVADDKELAQLLNDSNKKIHDALDEGDSYKVLLEMSLLTNAQMKALDIDHRSGYIKHILYDTGNVGYQGENLIVRLIETTPTLEEDINKPSDPNTAYTDQITELFNRFSKNSGSRYNTMQSAVDGEEFNKMQQALQTLAYKKGVQDLGKGNYSKTTEEIRQKGAWHPNFVVFKTGAGGDGTWMEFNEDGKLEVHFAITGSGPVMDDFISKHSHYKCDPWTIDNVTTNRFTATFNPYDLIGVLFWDETNGNPVPHISQISSSDPKNHPVQVLPAIALKEMEVEDTREMRATMLLILDGILTVVSLGEWAVASTALKAAFAAIDAAVGLIGMAIGSLRKTLMKYEAGRVILGIMDAITVGWGIVGGLRLSYAMYQMGKGIIELRRQFNLLKSVMKESEEFATLRTIVDKLEKPGPMFKKIFNISNKAGYDNALEEIDAFTGLTNEERKALRDFAGLRLANAEKGTTQFLEFIGKAPQDLLVEASKVKNEGELLAFRKKLEGLEKQGKITSEQRGLLDADVAKRVSDRASLVSALKKEFLQKTGITLPDEWAVFAAEHNVQFAEKLKAFRGNTDLSFNRKFRGGEGQLFETPLREDLVIKRWFGDRILDMDESIRLIQGAEMLVTNSPELNKVLDVVSFEEKGIDWVIRGFDKKSIPIKSVSSDPFVIQAKQTAIELLSQEKGEIAKNILKKLYKNSSNLHWSPTQQKILIIDMQ